MGFAPLSPPYKWLFLSFSSHLEDKSLISKFFWFEAQQQDQQQNSEISAH